MPFGQNFGGNTYEAIQPVIILDQYGQQTGIDTYPFPVSGYHKDIISGLFLTISNIKRYEVK